MGYEHKTVNSSKGEYVRDEDGDGFYEVHMKTTEGVWALLTSPPKLNKPVFTP
jgi:transposase